MPYIRLDVPNDYSKQDSGFHCNQSVSSDDSQLDQDADSLPLKLKMIDISSAGDTKLEQNKIIQKSVSIDDVDANLQSKIERILMDIDAPLDKRFNAMFYLRAKGNFNAIKCMVKTLTEISVNDNILLEHEMAHILGQMLGIADHEITDQDTLNGVFSKPEYSLVRENLEEVLKESGRDPTTRHEAGESLGAILSVNSLPVLDKYANEKFENSPEVRDTCFIAASRIRWYLSIKERISLSKHEARQIEIQLENKNPFTTVDPAPPMDVLQYPDSDDIENRIRNACDLLTRPRQDIFIRYRCLFTLRNVLVHDLMTDRANGILHFDIVNSLVAALHCFSSALLRHEVGFVLGQILSVINNNPDEIKILIREQILNNLEKTVRNNDESDMVRHEASTGFGECCGHDKRSEDLLVEFSGEDKNSILRDSCIVTLNMAVNNEEWLAQQFGIIE